jgi:hypothetical protein
MSEDVKGAATDVAPQYIDHGTVAPAPGGPRGPGAPPGGPGPGSGPPPNAAPPSS